MPTLLRLSKTLKTLGVTGAMIAALLPIAPVSAQNYQTITVTYPYYGFVEDPENPWDSVYDALDETGTAEYSDEFFSEPSPGDHPELRVISYALALAGFENQADGYPGTDPSNPNPKLKNLLDQIGFSDYESWDISSEENGHSIGTTIAHKTLENGQELIVIAPRNYNYMTEWLSNFNVGTSGDHAGFSESARFIKDRFDQYLSTRNLSNYKVWTVGYSRGGGVIDLFAKTINENISDYEMSPNDFYVYTFGAPKGSIVETNYTNIHDVKDGNDLILGNVFPTIWGFHNTGTYEEIHPADLEAETSVVNIADLADPEKAFNVLANNEKLTEQVGTMNGKAFMDEWFQFVTDSGLTRDYFDTAVKPPLSAIMKLYQMRKLDEQSDFTNFLKDTSKGLAGMVAGNALYDLLSNYGGDLSAFPVYNQLVSVLKGTATEAETEPLITKLTEYIGEYDDYEEKFGEAPTITREEFAVLKDNLPELVRSLIPIIIADAAYTQRTYGEDYSLYYTYTLGANAENFVIGHIPESIMPILKSLVENDDPGGDDPVTPEDPEDSDDPAVPNTGAESLSTPETSTTSPALFIITSALISGSIATYVCFKKYKSN